MRWRSGPVQPAPVNQVRPGREQPSSASLVCRRSPGRHLTPHEPITNQYGGGMDSLETVAPAFVDMAHQIVWATAATVNSAGEPSDAHPAPDLGVGRRTPAGLDRHLAAVAQGQASGADADDVVDVLAAEPRHVHGPLPHRVGRHAGRAGGVVGALQRGARTARLCALDHPRVDVAGSARLRRARTRARSPSVSWRAARWSGGDGLLLEWRAD